MKRSSNITTAEGHDQLVSGLREFSQSPRGLAGHDIAALKSKAQRLLIWITRHQDDVDRHELADICKTGKKTIMEALKADRNTDIAELDAALWELEARQMACDEAFAEELRELKCISPEIIDGLTPDCQRSIRYRIAKATANIYKSTDTPAGILDEIERYHSCEMDFQADEIISLTLDNSSFSTLLKRSIYRESLKEYIKERLNYIDHESLIQQVTILLNNIDTAYTSPTTSYVLPRDFNSFMTYYNELVHTLDQLQYVYNYQAMSFENLYLGPWDIYTYHLVMVANFGRFDSEIKEMKSIINDIHTKQFELLHLIEDYYYGRKEKPSFISEGHWNHAMKRIGELYEELSYGRLSCVDRDLSSYEEEIARLIAGIS